MSLDALKVFSRLHGFEAPEGIFAAYIPERGWCRNLKYAGNNDYLWTKKFRSAHIVVNPKTLARWLEHQVNQKSIPTGTMIVNVLTLKTWKPAEFVTEFRQSVKKFKRQRGPCPRCTRTISILKSGKSAQHWCWCKLCHQSKQPSYNHTGGCVKGCPNSGL